VSNPILEELLGDSTDDVRLVAFGMLDAEEKKISTHIRNERENLLLKPDAEHRFASLKHLAELHWELVYASLAQGELRQHILVQALGYAEAALDMDLPANSGLLFLKGRILLQQGEIAAAKGLIEQAVAQGHALSSALPYLAEMAFKERDFVRVQEMMSQLAAMNIATKTRAIADLWIGRDNVSNFNDRRFLPHL
jgi:tetratricopeptide (TPR) repeat protein